MHALQEGGVQPDHPATPLQEVRDGGLQRLQQQAVPPARAVQQTPEVRVMPCHQEKKPEKCPFIYLPKVLNKSGKFLLKSPIVLGQRCNFAHVMVQLNLN